MAQKQHRISFKWLWLFLDDSNIDRNHSYKEDKYSPLVADLSRNFKTYQFSVEVSARGQVTKANRARLKSFAYRCCDSPKDVTRLLVKNCSKASLLCSYSLFSARKEPSWASPNPLIARWLAYSFFFFNFLSVLLQLVLVRALWVKTRNCIGQITVFRDFVFNQ